MAEMSSDFRQGFILGMAMHPLVVSTDYNLAPVIWLKLDGNINNTGTDKVVTVTAQGDDAITYYDDNGSLSYSATAKNSIKITNCKNYLDGDFTIALKFRLSDNGLSPYPQYRRIVWFSFDSKYTGAEVGYSGNTTSNTLCIAYNGTNLALGTTKYNDNAWHALVLRKFYNSMHLTVDGVTITANSNVFYTPSDYIILSDVDYTLNGQISDFRLYNAVVGDAYL